MKHIPISIAIITRNREGFVSECLDSLCDQALFSTDQIVVVDSSNRPIENVVRSFRSKIRSPITYTYEPRLGFPVARNRAVKTATNNWVVFIDDDCVAHQDWVSTIQHAILAHPRAAVIAGASYTFYRRNVYCVATEINEHFWKSNSRRGDHIVNLEAIDNKNTIYDKQFLLHHQIEYDEKRTAFNGSSEDCDHGLQIQRAGGEGFYHKSLVVYHKDARTFFAYGKRLLVRLGGYYDYTSKWANHKTPKKHRRVNKITFLLEYFKTNHCPIVFALHVVFLLELSYMVIRIAKAYLYMYYRLQRV